MTAPPYVLCRDLGLTQPENCSIIIKAYNPSVVDELKCPCNETIEQVSSQLVKVNNREPVCEASVTNDNWMDAKYMLKLKATVDNKFDGDHVRDVEINVDYLVNDVVEQAKVNKKLTKVKYKMLSPLVPFHRIKYCIDIL